MTTTEPSTDTILEDVARIIAKEPERLSDLIHDTQRIGNERTADIFTWEIPDLDVSITVTVPVGSSTHSREKGYLIEARLGAIHVTHRGVTRKVHGVHALDIQMLRFNRTGNIRGLAEAVKMIDALTRTK